MKEHAAKKERKRQRRAVRRDEPFATFCSWGSLLLLPTCTRHWCRHIFILRKKMAKGIEVRSLVAAAAAAASREDEEEADHQNNVVVPFNELQRRRRQRRANDDDTPFCCLPMKALLVAGILAWIISYSIRNNNSNHTHPSIQRE